MSYAVRRVTDPRSNGSAPDSSNVAQPQPTTATVLDFICLFTHDLRRKQKRWQDGKLKYHTFNKRIMVYDDRDHFIGDAHWNMGGDLEPGEELELDRGAAIVQVEDCVGSREQDLTDVLDKRARDVEKRRAVAAAKTPSSTRRQETQPHFQLNHRPLSSIVPSPGPTGRAAIPQHSPYEARRAELNGDVRPVAPPAKKRRVETSPPSKAGFAQNLFGARLNLSASAVSLSSLRNRTLRETTNVRAVPVEVTTTRITDTSKLPAGDDTVVILDEDPNTNPVAIFEPLQLPMKPGVKETAAVAVHIIDEEEERINKDQQEKAATVKPRQDTDTSTAMPVQNKPVTLREKKARSRTEGPGAPSMQAKEVEVSAPLDVADVNSNMNERIAAVRQPNLSLNRRDDTPVSVDNARTAPRNKSKQTLENGGLNNKTSDRPAQHHERVKQLEQQQQQESQSVKKVEVPDHAPKVLPEARQRTELRIKSRKRRGLLMVSERKQDRHHDKTAVMATSNDEKSEKHKLADVDSPLQALTATEVEPSVETISATPEPSSSPDPSSGQQVNEEPNAGDALCAKANPSPQPRQGTIFANSSSDSEPPLTKRARRKALQRSHEASSGARTTTVPARRRDTTSTDHESSSDCAMEEDIPESSPSPPRKKPSRKREQRTTSHTGTEPNDAPQGPRIARMARKSVKSKEIIGFVPGMAESLVSAPFAMATGRIGTVGRPPGPLNRPPGQPARPKFDAATIASVNTAHIPDALSPADGDDLSQTGPQLESREHVLHGTVHPQLNPPVKPAAVAEVAHAADMEPESELGPIPRVVNPASRGKKAARKEDAAGSAPQSIVPFEAQLPQAARVPAKPIVPKQQDKDLPGFSKANGGAWSRHAEDLLGMTRPVGKRP